MIERVVPIYGRLVYDRNTVVRAAFRAHLESILRQIGLFSEYRLIDWIGDLRRGGIRRENGCGDCEVLAWTESGVVGLALDGWQGPIDQLGLEVDAVTGGPDDVRQAVPMLPEELEPTFAIAVGLLLEGNDGEKLAGAGFWLLGDRCGGTLFTFKSPYDAWGVGRLAAWGKLRNDRLPCACGDELHFDPEKPAEAPAHAVIDALVDRRLQGPTELTADELATLLSAEPNPKHVVYVQQDLQQVGITWPGSPQIPPAPVRPRHRAEGVSGPLLTSSVHAQNPDEWYFFDRAAIVRAALRAFIESTLAKLDPLDRHPFAASFVPRWTGDMKQGAFRNTDENGSYEVLAWSDVGMVGLAYENGYGPVEHLELPIAHIKGGPDDVRIAVTEMPAELEPNLVMAVSLLDMGEHGEKLASVGCWQHGEMVGGSLYEYYIQKGKERLRAWGKLKMGQLRRWYQNSYVLDLGRTKAAPIQALVDALKDRALKGPTELTADELATLLPTPPNPEKLLNAQRLLQQVGITWPGSSGLI